MINLPESAALYLLPNFLSEEKNTEWLCDAEIQVIKNLNSFITESRSALFTLLKRCHHPNPDHVEFIEFNEHHLGRLPREISDWFKEKRNIGLVSDAGLPSLADPGYEIVRYAHSVHYSVYPLPGPGAVYQAIMASGLYSQQFVFHGYLPREEKKLIQKLNTLHQHTQRENYSQFFIEAPYRNLSLMNKILQILPPHLYISVASGLLSPHQMVMTLPAEAWKQKDFSFLHKSPTLFGIGK